MTYSYDGRVHRGECWCGFWYEVIFCGEAVGPTANPADHNHLDYPEGKKRYKSLGVAA